MYKGEETVMVLKTTIPNFVALGYTIEKPVKAAKSGAKEG